MLMKEDASQQGRDDITGRCYRQNENEIGNAEQSHPGQEPENPTPTPKATKGSSKIRKKREGLMESACEMWRTPQVRIKLLKGFNVITVARSPTERRKFRRSPTRVARRSGNETEVSDFSFHCNARHSGRTLLEPNCSIYLPANYSV